MADALNSLYGAGHAEASKTFTRECVAMPGVREQTVLTPEKVNAPLREMYPGGWYDPCPPHGTRGLIDPWTGPAYCNPPYGTCLRDPERDLATYTKEQAVREEQKAAHKLQNKRKTLKLKPFSVPTASLEDWLRKSVLSNIEVVVLVPNRSHRKWMRTWKRQQDAIIEMDPLKFEGEKQAAPFPLVLGYRGPRVLDFVRIFRHLGDPT